MLTIRLSDGNDFTADAHAHHVTKDGSLELLAFERIGRYSCPLRTTVVATLAPGTWVRVTEHKDTDGS